MKCAIVEQIVELVEFSGLVLTPLRPSARCCGWFRNVRDFSVAESVRFVLSVEMRKTSAFFDHILHCFIAICGKFAVMPNVLIDFSFYSVKYCVFVCLRNAFVCAVQLQAAAEERTELRLVEWKSATHQSWPYRLLCRGTLNGEERSIDRPIGKE